MPNAVAGGVRSRRRDSQRQRAPSSRPPNGWCHAFAPTQSIDAREPRALRHRRLGTRARCADAASARARRWRSRNCCVSGIVRSAARLRFRNRLRSQRRCVPRTEAARRAANGIAASGSGLRCKPLQRLVSKSSRKHPERALAASRRMRPCTRDPRMRDRVRETATCGWRLLPGGHAEPPHCRFLRCALGLASPRLCHSRASAHAPPHLRSRSLARWPTAPAARFTA